jgi:hypothetical protein
MTTNPHRGSDFADFLTEQDLMTPTMTPTSDLPVRLREFNRWRRGDETLEQPHPKDIGKMIDAAADRLEELERELAAERALADRLAEALDGLDWVHINEPKALAAWKEARNV